MTAHRVLIVEDDHQLRAALARGLREEGFTVSTAADGASALRAAEADAVVLDIRLPDSDGRDVCQALRARGMDAPVLFLTAHDALVDRLSGFSSGGDDYLAKPIHLAELAARLRAALRRAGPAHVPGRCALSDVVADLAALWPATAPGLAVQTPAEELTAGASPEIVERILAPLLDNARRHAATTVTVRMEPGAVGPGVRIVVHDDGAGVPEPARDQVFEPGFRAEPANGHPGAGLGLALARRLARSVGGDLTLEGKTAFAVSLPPG
ncbi:response regulator [Actinomadura nitritigenes]|uniref:hybrid sensor histidine kinase/response regulator n=1 Tax=Actinomadura nitritigenes TaxID=134602 RepID=UPI00368E04E3